MNWRRGFWLWFAFTAIWYFGYGISGYLTAPSKDWIYWSSSTQSLALSAPSDWKENKPVGFGDTIIQTRQGLKIAIPSNLTQRYRQASYLQRVESEIWKRHRANQLMNNWKVIVFPIVVLILGWAIMLGIHLVQRS